MHRHAPRVLSTRTRVSNRRTPALHVPACKLRGSPTVLLSSSSHSHSLSPSLCLFFGVLFLCPATVLFLCPQCLVFRRSSATSLSLFVVEHPRTPIPVVGFAYRHCCSYHTPCDPSLHPRLHPREADCESTSRLPSGTARLRRPARPIVSIEGHLAHPRINYYA